MHGALHAPGTAIDVCVDIARAFTPRFEVCGEVVVLDLSGLARLFGDGDELAAELRRAALDRGIDARVAIAGTCTAVRILVTAVGTSPDVCVVPVGAEGETLAMLPVERLASVDADDTAVATFRRWGLQTLGDIAALPPDALSARLGAAGVTWQRLARGEDLRPLRPTLPDERFEQTLDLEWPIEGLEPLAFVLTRLLDPLSAHLERRGRSAVALRLVLHLVTRSVHERELQLPAPMRDAVTFRTLLMLDLESHPPPAAIDRVTVTVEPTPARVLQFSLLTRALPSPERLSTLTARLGALMGEGRCGSPAVVDSWRPGAHAVMPFVPRESNGTHRVDAPGERDRGERDRVVIGLRRFRMPVAATVRTDHSRPTHVATGRRDLVGPVETCAGPWRTSGLWWETGAWDRDEWDVTFRGGVTCRLFRDRGTNGWFVEGIVD